MATSNITCTPTDLWTGSGGHTLPAQISNEIWDKAFEGSAILKAARHIRIPGSGLSIPVITSEAEASWVGETCAKPVTDAPTWDFRTLRAYKLAVIETFSDEFTRDWAGLYRHLVEVLPRAIWQKFDATVFGNSPAPGADFDTLADAPVVNLDSAPSTYGGLTDVLTKVAEAGGDVTAWLATPALRARLLTATDALGHPFFANNPAGQREVGSVFGAPVYPVAAGTFKPPVIGAAGDFARGAIIGTVGDIRIKRSDQATVVTKDGTQVNLWQQNMTAVLVEFEVGFLIRDKDWFVQIAGTATGGQAQSGLGASGMVNVDAELVDVHADKLTLSEDVPGGTASGLELAANGPLLSWADANPAPSEYVVLKFDPNDVYANGKAKNPEVVYRGTDTTFDATGGDGFAFQVDAQDAAQNVLYHSNDVVVESGAKAVEQILAAAPGVQSVTVTEDGPFGPKPARTRK